MRILEISALPLWTQESKGGMPSLRETVRGHVRGGHQVVLALPKYDILGDYAQPVTIHDNEGCEVYLVPCRWALVLARARRLAYRLGGGKKMPYLLRWVLNLLLYLLLTGSLIIVAFRLSYGQKWKFDLVYAHNQYSSLAGWLIGRLFGIPNVTRLYGTFMADLIKKPLVWFRYPVAAAGFLIPHSLLICANDGTRGDEVAIKLGIDMKRFRFWQNGVDLPTRPPSTTRVEILERYQGIGLRDDSQWILSCSRLSYWKRIDRMFYALKYAREEGCDCQLLVAGNGAERERLSNLAMELDIANSVIWLGAIHHDQIWELMHVADVFMITNDVTNRCNPLFEAICARLPVISVRDPSTADLLEHGVNALLADKQDLQGIGANLRRICRDSDLAVKLRSAQQLRTSEFWSWTERMETEVRELEKLVAYQGNKPKGPCDRAYGRGIA
jgi:glycosyltransferase involved in cell wall biosynthesis